MSAIFESMAFIGRIWCVIALLWGVEAMAVGYDNGPRLEIRYAIPEAKVIGPLKAGSLCLPNGSVRWEDMRLPQSDEVEQAVLAAYGRGFFEGRVRLTVEDMQLRLCMPGMQRLMGKPKGQGVVRLRWHHVRTDGTLVGEGASLDMPFPVEGMDPRRSSDSMKKTLIEGVNSFVGAERGASSL